MKKIIVVSRNEFNKIMCDNDINESNVESKTKVAFISINGTFDENKNELYFKQNKENLLILFFDDVLEDIKSGSRTVKAFSRQQGEIVFDFLEKMKDRDLLLIHCHAGISRSGAIGQFAAEYYGIDFKEFRKMNRQIHPNSTVLRVLRDIQRHRQFKSAQN